MPQSSSASKPRTVLGRYELLAHLASGGMAEVWLARMTGAKGFGRFFALKRMHRTLASQDKFVRMFLDEAEVASHVQHPNVVPIFELGEEEGELFLVMDLVVGVSFSTMLARSADRGERLPLEAVVQIVCDTALGLHAAHTAKAPDGNPLGIVHRDVSPQNVLVGVDGRARVVDFGIAKALMRSTETQTGELKGKLSYYSPEQALAKPVDARSDVFSLGIVLWEALVGQRLFRSDSPLDTLRRITQDTIPSPSSMAPVPEAIGRVALHALTRERAQRIQSASAFDAELRTAALSAGIVPSGEAITATLEREAGDKISALRSLVSRRWTQRHEVEGGGTAMLSESDLESASGVRMSDTLVTPPSISMAATVDPLASSMAETVRLPQQSLKTGPLAAYPVPPSGARSLAETGPLVAQPKDALASTGPMPESFPAAALEDELGRPRRSGAPIVAAIVIGLAAAVGGGTLAWFLTAREETSAATPTSPAGGAATLGSVTGAGVGATGPATPSGPDTPSTTPPASPVGPAVPVIAPVPVHPVATPVASSAAGSRTQRSARTTRPASAAVTRPAPFVTPAPPPLRIPPPASDPPPVRTTRTSPPAPTPAPRLAPAPSPTPTTATQRRGVVRDYDEE
ncbi:MAG: protein kinase [Deltaproteobacteria bacterium]|nr:protein kinase [Deltaproteobacteria bacterium]